MCVCVLCMHIPAYRSYSLFNHLRKAIKFSLGYQDIHKRDGKRKKSMEEMFLWRAWSISIVGKYKDYII